VRRFKSILVILLEILPEVNTVQSKIPSDLRTAYQQLSEHQCRSAAALSLTWYGESIKVCFGLDRIPNARVAELADAPDLGSGGETHGGSSPPSRTSNFSTRTLQLNYIRSIIQKFDSVQKPFRGCLKCLLIKFRSLQGNAMRNLFGIVLVAVLIFALTQSVCNAQQYYPYWGYGNYYSYYPNNAYGPPPQPAPYANRGPVVRPNPYQYRMAPNPYVYWQWNRHNRFENFEVEQRSPLNPESELDYLLRTF
jgi:hypothetical protein